MAAVAARTLRQVWRRRGNRWYLSAADAELCERIQERIDGLTIEGAKALITFLNAIAPERRRKRGAR